MKKPPCKMFCGLWSIVLSLSMENELWQATQNVSFFNLEGKKLGPLIPTIFNSISNFYFYFFANEWNLEFGPYFASVISYLSIECGNCNWHAKKWFMCYYCSVTDRVFCLLTKLNKTSPFTPNSPLCFHSQRHV